LFVDKNSEYSVNGSVSVLGTEGYVFKSHCSDTALLLFMDIYFLSAILLLILSFFFVFLAANPVHAALNLVSTFFHASILLFFLGVNFLGSIFIIIYVGAIAILFLFVIMMLDIKIETNDAIFYFFIPFSLGVYIVCVETFNLLDETIFDFYLIKDEHLSFFISFDLQYLFLLDSFPLIHKAALYHLSDSDSLFILLVTFHILQSSHIINIDCLSNINVLGQTLFNPFLYCFLISGVVLLIAMLGAIILTFNFDSVQKDEFILRDFTRSISIEKAY